MSNGARKGQNKLEGPAGEGGALGKHMTPGSPPLSHTLPPLPSPATPPLPLLPPLWISRSPLPLRPPPSFLVLLLPFSLPEVPSGGLTHASASDSTPSRQAGPAPSAPSLSAAGPSSPDRKPPPGPYALGSTVVVGRWRSSGPQGRLPLADCSDPSPTPEPGTVPISATLPGLGSFPRPLPQEGLRRSKPLPADLGWPSFHGRVSGGGPQAGFPTLPKPHTPEQKAIDSLYNYRCDKFF